MIKFGDTFLHKEKEYVFLAKTEDIVYAAQILDEQKTNNVNRLYELKSRTERCEDRILFCFVILKTEEFKNRMVHFKNTARGEDKINFDELKENVLNSDDLREIKEEIVRSGSPIPLELKEMIKKFDV